MPDGFRNQNMISASNAFIHFFSGRFSLILSSCLVLLTSCENNEAEVANLSSDKPGVEVAKDVSINYTVGGHIKAILSAPLMYRVQDSIPYVEFPNSLHADFYNDSAVMESKLDARYGTYKETSAIIFLRDSVRVVNLLKGDTLICEEMYWNQNRPGREFFTDKPVKIRTRTQVIDGVGMESGQDFRNWRILKPKGTLQVPGSSFPE
jgi:LPS export ABC transporter protein LptC